MKDLHVRFIFDSGERAEVRNIKGYKSFNEFVSVNCKGDWSLYNDCAINLNKVIKIEEVTK